MLLFYFYFKLSPPVGFFFGGVVNFVYYHLYFSTQCLLPGSACTVCWCESFYSLKTNQICSLKMFLKWSALIVSGLSSWYICSQMKESKETKWCVGTVRNEIKPCLDCQQCRFIFVSKAHYDITLPLTSHSTVCLHSSWITLYLSSPCISTSEGSC